MRLPSSLLTLALGLLLAPAWAPSAWSSDTVTQDELPPAVKMKLNSVAKGGSVTSIEKVTDKAGHHEYVAHIKVGSEDKTVTITSDGSVKKPDHDEKKPKKK